MDYFYSDFDQAQSIHEEHQEISTSDRVLDTYDPIKLDPLKVKKYEKIGHGSYANVYKGILETDDGEQQLVAVKETHPHKDKTIDKSVEEIRLVSKLNHPNVIKTLGYYIDDIMFKIIIVMEFGAISLRGFLDSVDFKIGLGYKLNILRQIAAGMRHVHEQDLLHRDLKCDNIVMSSNPEDADQLNNVVFKLIDLSFERGTLNHMPPEAIDKRSLVNGDVDRVSDVGRAGDVYSFGVLAWELLTGKKAFDGAKQYDLICRIGKNKETELIPDYLNEDVKQLIKDMWNSEWEKRPSFKEIEERLEKIEDELDGEESIAIEKIPTECCEFSGELKQISTDEKSNVLKEKPDINIPSLDLFK